MTGFVMQTNIKQGNIKALKGVEPLKLNIGETPIENAPHVTLPNGQTCVPQHYLRYSHDRQSVEAIVSDISYDPHFPVFVSEDKGGVFIQIGIVGYDNYKSQNKQTKPKIVFGRRWRVEPNLPSSEIIQTVFLALKKAREHELRELFTLNYEGTVTTPFNNHHDIPLMASQKTVLTKSNQIGCDTLIEAIAYDGEGFSDLQIERTQLGPIVVSLIYQGQQDFIPSRPLAFMLETFTDNAFVRGVMKALIDLSDAHLDKHFKYKGFARFSSDVDTLAISEVSRLIRQAPERIIEKASDAKKFAGTFETERYETDATRIPALGESDYSRKIRDHLAQLDLSNFSMVCGAHGAEF